MANHGDSSQDENVQEKSQDGGEKESPRQEGREITPALHDTGEGDGATEVPGTRETAAAAAAGEGSAEMKKGNKDDAGASGSGIDKKRKKGDLIEIPSGSPTCYLCRRRFQSWKAVFGHMRAHKIGEERVRGAFPPPVFTPPGSPQREGQTSLRDKLVPTLFDIAQDVLGRRGGLPAARGLNIDLNQQPPQGESPSTSSPSSPKEGGGSKLDLNKPPPPEGGDGDGGAGSA